MKAVVAVIGNDRVGILAKVSAALTEKNANIVEMTQSVLDGYFTMIVIVSIEEMVCSIDELQTYIKEKVDDMQVLVMHENIFNSMHRI
ncbi:MAG: ACT domain-containing protein [Firmicutes bacterium]|nr:ACT domain-containing protein [Bacillota bacterium]